MVQTIFENWKKSHDTITKLQWVYVVVGSLLVMLAGLVALLNESVSRSILSVAGTVFMVFLVNLVSWSVLGGILAAKRTTKNN